MPEQRNNTTDQSVDNSQTPRMEHALILQDIISKLMPLPASSIRRVIDTICTFFGIERTQLDSILPVSNVPPSSSSSSSYLFSENEPPSPKEFMVQKAPMTDVERVACLAYYLTHYRGTPHFKTRDISDLNTEAAQRRFSNTAFAVTNATNGGYLVPSVKGCKQISAAGEQCVQALPDRDAVREAQDRLKPRKSTKRTNKKKPRPAKKTR